MNTDPQTAPNANGHTQPSSTVHGAPSAPHFPSGPLRDWLSHRVRLSLPVWVLAVAALVLIGVVFD